METNQRLLSLMKFWALQIVLGPIFEGERGEREHKKLTGSTFFLFIKFKLLVYPHLFICLK